MTADSVRFPCGHEPRNRGGRVLPPELARQRVAEGGRCVTCGNERKSRAAKHDANRAAKAERMVETWTEDDGRGLVGEALRAMGFRCVRSKGGSDYYELGEFRVRLSDHPIPQTDERDYRRARGGQDARGDVEILLVNNRGGVVSRDGLRRRIAAVEEMVKEIREGAS